MIPKDWRDYTWQVRPLYVLGCVFVSPVIVIAFVLLARLNVDWPAWVQAVGSVGAILAAIWVANRQHAETKLERDAQAQVVTTFILTIAGRVTVGAGLLRHCDIKTIDTTLDYLERELRMLQRVDILRLPKAEMIQSVLQLMANIEITVTKVRTACVSPINLPLLYHEGHRAEQTFESIEHALIRAAEN